MDDEEKHFERRKKEKRQFFSISSLLCIISLLELVAKKNYLHCIYIYKVTFDFDSKSKTFLQKISSIYQSFVQIFRKKKFLNIYVHWSWSIDNKIFFLSPSLFANDKYINYTRK
jgi:hypothetical protein